MSRKKIKHPALCMTALALGSMIAYNRREYVNATANNVNKKEECRIYTGRFGNIAYKRAGSGKPILLIHNLNPASNLTEWNTTMQKLAKDYSVYAIDLPGCGNSDKSNTEYSTYMYALAVNDFVLNRICRGSELRIINAVASCASSSILICAAVLNPSLYEHIVLVNPQTIESTYCNPTTNPDLVRFMRHAYNTPVIGSFIYNTTHSRKKILSRLSAPEYSHLTEREKEQLADSMYESAHIGGFNSRFLDSSIHGNLLNVDMPGLLARLSVDCSVILGSNIRKAQKTVDELTSVKEDIRITRLDDMSSPNLEDAICKLLI